MTPADLTNIHPADELSSLREEIAQLEKRAAFLRDQLLQGKVPLRGNQYEAIIIPQTRESLDKAALIQAYGDEAIRPYIKSTSYSIVKLRETESHEA